MLDVLIAGAGPAGWITAIRLARAGARVAVLDRARRERVKIGECLPGAVSRLLQRLELPPLDELTHRRVRGATSLWAGTLQHRDFMTEFDGAGWRIDRVRFERDLEKVGLECGVERCDGHVRDLRREPGGWWVRTGHAEYAARFIVDATGRGRAVARRLAINALKGPPLVALWAVGSPVEAGLSPTDRTLTETVTHGWWYGAYLPDQRPVAVFHCSPSMARTMVANPNHWRSALAATRLLSKRLNPESYRGVTPTAVEARSRRTSQACGDGWALCGDAALALDPIASQGIFNALATGDMLAQALVSHRLSDYNDRLTTVASFYERRRASFYRDAEHHHGGVFWPAHSKIAT